MTPESRPAMTTEELKQVFIHNLNRIYFGKRYLDSHFENLINMASFSALKLALEEIWNDVKNQISRMGKIYEQLNEAPSDKDCNPIRAIIKDNYCLDEKQSLTFFTDTDVIAYVQMLEHINMSAYNMLKVLALKLKNKEVQQLLTECFDESKEDEQLFLLIAKEYLSAS